MTETLQRKIDAIVMADSSRRQIDKAIQELREEIQNLLPNGRFSELPKEEQDKAIICLKVLALIGEKK